MRSKDLNEGFQRAAALVASADALLVCAGAGMGVDSGLPDFRGDEGFWRAYPALGRARLSSCGWSPRQVQYIIKLGGNRQDRTVVSMHRNRY